MKTAMRWIALALLLGVGCTPPSGEMSKPAPPASIAPHAAGDRNVRFGVPAPASADPANRDAYLVVHSQFTLSYNGSKRIPNWVSWQLRKEDIGNAERGAFEHDDLLPKSFTTVSSRAYDGCGFDRGHMCPAQDRSATQADMDATFVTTNVIPQAPLCNQRGWERLESYCRDLTKKGSVLQINCGPAGAGGEGKEGVCQQIGKNSATIAVPAKVWKVVLVLPNENAQPDSRTRTIAVIMPNDQSVDYDWAKYRVPVRDVERLTGYTFFPQISGDVAAAIKAKADATEVRVPRPSK